jgi:hypothetical protein
LHRSRPKLDGVSVHLVYPGPGCVTYFVATAFKGTRVENVPQARGAGASGVALADFPTIKEVDFDFWDEGRMA